MVRASWIVWLAAAVAQAQQQQLLKNATVEFDTSPQRVHCDQEGMELTMSVRPHALDPSSPLLQPRNTSSSSLEARRSIQITNVWIGVSGFGTAILGANAALDMYDNIAGKINKKSDKNSCTLTYGTEYDDSKYVGYAFKATTTGDNCDTTAIEKTIRNAVHDCADKLHTAGVVTGCCAFNHGGTWTGHLQLTSQPDRFPAHNAQC